MSTHLRRLIFINLILYICSCHTNDAKEQKTSNSKNVIGLYSYLLALPEDADCESLKRTLRINADSTFVMKEYCFDKPGSKYKTIIKKGTWNFQNNSQLNFAFPDSTVFSATIVNDSTIQIITNSDLNYPYERDHTDNDVPPIGSK